MYQFNQRVYYTDSNDVERMARVVSVVVAERTVLNLNIKDDADLDRVRPRPDEDESDDDEYNFESSSDCDSEYESYTDDEE